MNNYTVYKDIFEEFSRELNTNTKLAVALSCFIGVNLIVTLLNIFSQNRIKNKEKKINSYNLKEKRRIEILESLYEMMEKISNFDFRENSSGLLAEIQLFEAHINSNKLYISKPILIILRDYSDYQKGVLIDFRKKDYAFELKIFDKFYKKFNM